MTKTEKKKEWIILVALLAFAVLVIGSFMVGRLYTLETTSKSVVDRDGQTVVASVVYKRSVGKNVILISEETPEGDWEPPHEVGLSYTGRVRILKLSIDGERVYPSPI